MEDNGYNDLPTSDADRDINPELLSEYGNVGDQTARVASLPFVAPSASGK